MFEPFQKFMTKAANRYGIQNEVKAADICQKFRALIPELFHKKQFPEENISPAHYKNSVLVINVKTPAWAQEVIMRKEKIISEINRKTGKEVVKNLRAQLSSK